MTKGHKPGGGIASKQHREVRVRTGTGSHSTNPGYVSQLGNKVGSHTRQGDSGYRGEKMHNDRSFQPVKFGNEVALNVGGGGAGKGRTIYASGSQGCQGQPAQGNPPPNSQRDALEQE
jgi:hypothetical protein